MVDARIVQVKTRKNNLFRQVVTRVFMVDDPSEGKGGGRFDPPLYDLFMKVGVKHASLPGNTPPDRGGIMTIYL